jgi:flagellar protein FliO/FliZ
LDNGLVASAPPDFGLAWLKMAGGLFLLLGLLYLAFYLIKRYGPRIGLPAINSRDLTLHSQIALGPRKTVVVVRFLNKFLVLGVTDTQINKITEMEAEHGSTTSRDFSRALREHTSQDPG